MQQIAVISLFIFALLFLYRRLMFKKKRCDSCAPAALNKGNRHEK